jgi:hypothetical protein
MADFPLKVSESCAVFGFVAQDNFLHLILCYGGLTDFCHFWGGDRCYGCFEVYTLMPEVDGWLFA